jgi:hypothetical protein
MIISIINYLYFKGENFSNKKIPKSKKGNGFLTFLKMSEFEFLKKVLKKGV